MLGPFLCGQVSLAPLIPKLRGHFAEFLNNASPAGLRILSSSTCVGLRYGPAYSYSGFSRRRLLRLPYPYVRSASGSDLLRGICLPYILPLAPGLLSRLRICRRVPTVLCIRGTGISTCCPSATLLSLALGPDLPRADQLYPGNLGYSAVRILTLLSLLIPAFSLPYTPPLLPVRLPHIWNAPLPMYIVHSAASVVCFSPGHFRRRTSRLVSCYALFECMAASEPTS